MVPLKLRTIFFPLSQNSASLITPGAQAVIIPRLPALPSPRPEDVWHTECCVFLAPNFAFFLSTLLMILTTSPPIELLLSARSSAECLTGIIYI